MTTGEIIDELFRLLSNLKGRSWNIPKQQMQRFSEAVREAADRIQALDNSLTEIGEISIESEEACGVVLCLRVFEKYLHGDRRGEKMNKSYCKGCGQEIRWIQTKDGKYMPVDPEPVLIRIQKGARHKFILNNGDVVSGEYMQRREIATFEAYETHWASCKAAGTFRREKR